MRYILSLVIGLLLPSFALGADAPQSPLKAGNRYVRTDLIVDKTVFQPTDSADKPAGRIGVHFQIEPGWHIYWKNSGEAAIPTKIQWQLPDGWRTGDLRWPVPTRFLEKGDITTYGYGDEVVLLADLFVPNVIPTNDTSVTLGAKVSWLVCKDICVPGERTLQLETILSPTKPEGPSKDFALINSFDWLTPRTEEDLRKLPGLASFSLRPHLVSADSEKHFVRVDITGPRCGMGANVAEYLQLFPESAPVQFGHPTGVITSAPTSDGEMPSTLCSYAIFLPTSAAVPDSTTLGGIIVLSPSLTAQRDDLAVHWNLAENGEEENLPANTPLGSQLSYRFVDHSKVDGLSGTKATAEQATTQIIQVTFLFALFSAFAAGLVLNLMPCVLPIISIKVMSFVGQADRPRREVIGSALAYAAGILATFLLLAVTLVLLKPIGYQVGWGFQFQQPPLVLAVTVIVFILSLAFFDLFQVQLPGMQEANRMVSKVHSPLFRHFFDGVLATALSTPCSAPFLGTALTFAFAQPALISITIFLFVGFGLALPYVLLALSPALVRFLPKPGPWMYRFRQILGFLLLGTVVWLLFVIDSLTEEGVVWTIGLLLLIYFAFWVNSWMRDSGASRGKRRVYDVLMLALVGFTAFIYWPSLMTKKGTVAVHASELIDWQPYSLEAFERALTAKAPIFIDFTAQWCITCKANEKLIIETKKVANAVRENKITPFKADWTTGSDEVTAALKRFGGFGVPYYVVISAKSGEATVLPTLLTPETLTSAFQKAGH